MCKSKISPRENKKKVRFSIDKIEEAVLESESNIFTFQRQCL